MKKTSIYILSFSIIAIILASAILTGYKTLDMTMESLSVDYNDLTNGESASSSSSIYSTPIAVRLDPSVEEFTNPTALIHVNEEDIHVLIEDVSVMVPDDMIPGWCRTIWLTAFPLQTICVLILIWKFIRFVLNIKKEDIFVRKNVRLLRQISILLFAITVLELINGCSLEYVVGLFKLKFPNYVASAQWDFPWSNLLLAFISLLMAQVWARGIEIQEEQALTI